jgi:hypothetical protein
MEGWVNVLLRKEQARRNTQKRALCLTCECNRFLPAPGLGPQPGLSLPEKLAGNLAGMRIVFHKQTNKLNDAPIAHAAHQASRR